MTPPVLEATAEVGKPGTNWKQVTPEHRRKIDAIVRHYMKQAHPFGACVRDNTKRFGKERAERICAVVKDMGERTTKWRKGNKKLTEAEGLDVTGAVFEQVIAPALAETDVTVEELCGWADDAAAAGILVEAQIDASDFSREQIDAAATAASARLATLAGLGLPATGQLARYDAALVEAFAEDAHPRARAGGRTGGQFIAKGSNGKDIRGVQRRVGARVDGDFGDKTRKAVERFQKRHGLTVDGVVGRQTVAALRGRKDAKRVKVGALSKADREFLAGHVRGKGGKRRAKMVEAVGHASFLDRVKGLEPGEHARLPDGGAVKHHATEDGRAVWTAGRPRSYATDGVGWGEQRRSPEEAVADAFTSSAASTDPESLGGPNRFSRYSPVSVNGQGAEFHGVDHDGQPLVRIGRGSPAPTTWTAISPAPRLTEASLPGFEGKHPRDRQGRWRAKHHVTLTTPHGTENVRVLKGTPLEIVSGEKDINPTVRTPDGKVGVVGRSALEPDTSRPGRDGPAAGGGGHKLGKDVKPGDVVRLRLNSDTPRDYEVTEARKDNVGVQLVVKNPDGQGQERATLDPGERVELAAGKGDNIDAYKVPGNGSITHKGTDPDGQAIRLRKERTGAFVVEKESASGSWLPNRFTDEKIARKHFLAQVKGGNAGAASETAGRLNLGASGRDLWEKYQTTPFGSSRAVTKVIKSEDEARTVARWLNANRSGKFEVGKTSAGSWIVRGVR